MSSSSRLSKSISQEAESAKEHRQVVAKLAKLLQEIPETNEITKIVANSFNDQFLAIVPNLRVLPTNLNVVTLQTVMRNCDATREHFAFNANRLIRLVIEEALNQLPYQHLTIKTPPGGIYHGVEFLKYNCGISIRPSGEAMEKALRDCCRAIRIGKMIIQVDEEKGGRPKTVYAHLPADISLRKVLLLEPIMDGGVEVVEAIRELIAKYGVKEKNIILVNLFMTPIALNAVVSRFAELTVQTAEIHPIVPMYFEDKYFGMD